MSTQFHMGHPHPPYAALNGKGSLVIEFLFLFYDSILLSITLEGQILGSGINLWYNPDMEDEQKTQSKTYYWLKPHQFKKGNPGGPGRPKGPTLKRWVKEHFELLSDEERADFLNKIDPLKAWEMAEGKPDTKQTLDATVAHKVDPETKKLMEDALRDM